LLALGACRSEATKAPPPRLIDAAVVHPPDAARPVDAGPPDDLVSTLDAHPFTYLRRRTATVARALYWNEIAPSLFEADTRVVYAVAQPGGPSLVCVKGEICWSFDGEMSFLYVDNDALYTAAPYLTVTAAMPKHGRVDLTLSLDDSARPSSTSDPARKVKTFDPDAPPAWAAPWIAFLDPPEEDMQIVSATSQVFVARARADGCACATGPAFAAARGSRPARRRGCSTTRPSRSASGPITSRSRATSASTTTHGTSTR